MIKFKTRGWEFLLQGVVFTGLSQFAVLILRLGLNIKRLQNPHLSANESN
jgi:hypothetical protein